MRALRGGKTNFRIMEKSKKFSKGLSELRICQNAAARAEIMEALGVNNRVSLRNYAEGRIKLDVLVADKIERIFRKYDVHQPWGDAPAKS